MVVYYQDIYYGVLRCLYVKSDINYVFLVAKRSIRGLKMSFPVNFRFISGEISAKNFLEKFYCTKRFVLEFYWGPVSYFWAIVPISAVIGILDDFGSLLAARTVTVKWLL